MKFIFLLLFSFCIASCNIARTSISILRTNPQDTIIFWHKTYLLKWSDYQGIPKDSLISNINMRVSAVTAASVVYKIHESTDSIICKVSCIFNKSLSWSKDTTRSTLEHEQLHFDIAELSAREMLKEFDSLRIAEITDINVFAQKAIALKANCNKINELYDQETKHGYIQLAQKKWEEKIAQELNKLKEYESITTIGIEK